MRANIYYVLLGGHYHMRVFIYGAKMGDLVCRKEEFADVIDSFKGSTFINEGDEK